MSNRLTNIEPEIFWDGDGLPPLGCECEREAPRGWEKCKINYVSDKIIVYTMLASGSEYASLISSFKFRPLRTEAERRRDHQVEAISQILTYRNGCSPKPMAGWIVDAIAAGKVPGIGLTNDAGS